MGYSCKILSIDGGGVRGVIPAYFLQQIATNVPKYLFECFDVICGTSAGGLIALALTTPRVSGGNPALPMSTEDILNVFLDDYGDIFDKQDTGWATYYSPAYWLYQKLDPTCMTLLDAQSNLQKLFNGKSICRQVAVTSYAMSPDTAPYLFNWHTASNPADNYYVWEAALATSAAPSYFPLAHVGGKVKMANLPKGIPPPGQTMPNGSGAAERWAVDGGVVANDPVMFAYAQAPFVGCNMSNPLVVSLGTGTYDNIVKVPQNSFDNGNWGDGQWVTPFYGSDTDVNGNPLMTPPLLGVVLSNQQAPEMQIQTIAPYGNYMRLEPPVSYGQYPFDSNDAAALQGVAKAFIAPGGDGYQTFQNIVDAVKS